jgi:hypothetical protein
VLLRNEGSGRIVGQNEAASDVIQLGIVRRRAGNGAPGLKRKKIFPTTRNDL